MGHLMGSLKAMVVVIHGGAMFIDAEGRRPHDQE